MIKKILLGLVALIVLALLALSALVYFNKDEIIAEVKNTANTNLVNAKMNFSGVDVSLFRQWPKLTVSLDSLQVMGEGKFKGVQLFKTTRLDVGLDLMQAIFGSEAVIESVHLEEPDIHIYALSDGSANYDITKPTETTTTTSASTKLEKYSISKGKITYDDRGLDMKMVLEGVEHTGKGNFSDVIFDLDMKTDAQKATLDYGGMRYFSKAHLVYDAVLNMDLGKSKYTFNKNAISINDLKLMFDGWVALPNETDTQMDMTFASPQSDFKSFLSIIPGAYTKDYSAVKADGAVSFAGKVKGTLNENVYPTFDLKLKIDNASIKYPDLPLGLSGIKVDAHISNPTTSLNGTVVNIPAFALKVGNNPIEGYFKLKTPMTDPDIDTKLKGTLKFDELAKAYPMPDVKQLTGTMIADIMMKARMSQIDAAQYETMQVAGNVRIMGMNYQPTVGASTRINDMAMDFTPQKVLLNNFDAKVGNSDIKANGSIDNILAYYAKDKTMRGKVTMNSVYMNAADFAGEPEATPTGNVPDDAPAEAAVFDRWDFDMDARIGTLVYEEHKLTNAVMVGHFTPNKMTFSELSTKIGASDIAGSGTISNVFNYLYDNQTLHGNLNLKSNYLDMNQFMTDEKDVAATQTPAEVIPVPKNVEMTINGDFGKVLYTNHTLTNVNGQIIVEDEKARLSDCTANLLGGQVGLNGLYSTADAAKPVFNMDMALKDFGFKEAYAQMATIKALAPIAQFIDGKFNTNLSMSGVLGKDMTPDFKTISAAGLLETFNAVLNNFKITNELGNKLNLDYLKQMELKNSKNWFEIKDGKIKVAPFDVAVRDAMLNIGGTSGFDSEMEYAIKARVPRKTLEANPVGAAAATGIGWLRGEASKYNVNINQGEFVNVQMDITGSMLAPKVKFKILASDGTSTVQDAVKETAAAVVEKAKDSLTNRANQELDKVKDKANAAVDKATDSLRNVANREAEKLKDKAVETVKDKVGEVVGKEVGDKVGGAVGDKVNEKAGEVLGDQGKKTVNDVKEKLNGWDPFKKKKN
jgi:AsmA-like C-terminal region